MSPAFPGNSDWQLSHLQATSQSPSASVSSQFRARTSVPEAQKGGQAGSVPRHLEADPLSSAVRKTEDAMKDSFGREGLAASPQPAGTCSRGPGCGMAEMVKCTVKSATFSAACQRRHPPCLGDSCFSSCGVAPGPRGARLCHLVSSFVYLAGISPHFPPAGWQVFITTVSRHPRGVPGIVVSTHHAQREGG